MWNYFLKKLCMFENIYKIKKFSHFEKLLNAHFYKPICCIFLESELLKNKEFYKNLKDTLKVSMSVNNYIAVLIVDITNMEEFKDLSNKITISMYYKYTKQVSETLTDINVIPKIVANIELWNNSYVASCLVKQPHEKHTEPQQQSIIEEETLEEPIKTKTKTKTKSKKEPESEKESSICSDNNSLSSEIKLKMHVLEEKQKLLEGL